MPVPRLRIFISSVQREFEELRSDLKAFLLGDAVLRRFISEVFLFEELPARDRRADQVYLEEVARLRHLLPGDLRLRVRLRGRGRGLADGARVRPRDPAPQDPSRLCVGSGRGAARAQDERPHPEGRRIGSQRRFEYYREGGSEKHLRDIAGVLKISGPQIDFPYIDEWADLLGLAEIWKKVRGAAGRP